ncbi:MAG: hypothetical protein ACERKD_18870 [Prolixibacteraceae bacterium]
MKTKFVIILILIYFLCWNCKSDEYVDPNYPTIYNALSEQAYNQVYGQLQQTPFSTYTMLDTFGFPILVADYDSLNAKDWRYKTSPEQLLKLTKEAIVEFGYFFHVTDSSLVSIRNIATTKNKKYDLFMKTFPDSLPTVWKVTTNQQIYNGIDVRGTSLSLVFSPYGLEAVGGHWFNEIYFPDSLIYNENAAKKLIMDETLSYNNTTITPDETTSWQTSKKIVFPIRKSHQIELRICWAIYPETWEVIIDTQTGEIFSAINISVL